jgi:antitoxin (DNA-binding transcriptional repressor) of toxin-antitoxin stability system
MKVTATEFRKNVFQLLESAINGEAVDVSHKGRTIRLLPEEQPSKLSRLSKRNILVGSAEEVDQSLESLNEQSQKDWEVKWQSS